MLNVHQLRVFVAVVDHRSFTRAAEHLHLTQPAVSSQIRQLRALAGAPILRRDGGRVVPTAAGHALYQYAQEVLGATDALQRDFREINSGELEHLIVGGTRSYGAYLLPLLLARFHHKHPTLRLSLVDAASEALVERVHAGEVDAAVVRAEQIAKELRADLGTTHLYDDEIVVVESPDYPFARDQCLTLAEAANIPFVRTPIEEATIGTGLGHLLTAAGLGRQRVVMELGTWQGIKTAVRAGVGVAVAPESVVRRELTSGELRTVQIDGYQEVRGVALITSPHRRREGQSLVFQELLRFLTVEVPAALRPASHASVPLAADSSTDDTSPTNV